MIPNEILVEILSYIVYDRRIYGYKEIDYPQLLALMHVSRRFRVLLLQHEIWHDIKFDFAQFVDIYGGSTTTTSISIATTHFCRHLFSDALLRATLEVKTDWYFSSLEVVFAVLAYLPSFTKSARSIILNFAEYEGAMDRLYDCKNITRLDLQLAWIGPTPDLTEISSRLKTFRLDILNLSLNDKYDGHLRDLQGLQEYSVRQQLTSGHLEGILPTRSARTLTRLTLIRCHFLPDVTLKAFMNLKHLKTQWQPVEDSLRNLIWNLPAYLYSLETTLEIERQRVDGTDGTFDIHRKVDNLFSCPCLKNLKELCLRMLYRNENKTDDFEEYYVAMCMEMVKVLVGELRVVEKVEFWGGLDLKKVHVLGRLPNLQTLKWIVSEDVHLEGEDGIQDLSIGVREILTKWGMEVDVTIEIRPWDFEYGELLDPEGLDDWLNDGI